MPDFQVDIEKVFGTEYWTNVYTVQAPAITEASGIANQIVQIERAVLVNGVTITKVRTSLAGEENPDQFIVTPVNQNGTYEETGVGQLLPLFNCARVDFSAGMGRPARKYLRGLLKEGNVDGSTLTSGLVTHINTNYVAPLIALGTVAKQGGGFYTAGAVFVPIAMRQLRRGSRRRTTPVL